VHILLLGKLGIELTLQILSEFSVTFLSLVLLLACFGLQISERLIKANFHLINMGLLLLLHLVDLLVMACILLSDVLTVLLLHLLREFIMSLVMFL